MEIRKEIGMVSMGEGFVLAAVVAGAVVFAAGVSIAVKDRSDEDMGALGRIVDLARVDGVGTSYDPGDAQAGFPSGVLDIGGERILQVQSLSESMCRSIAERVPDGVSAVSFNGDTLLAKEAVVPAEVKCLPERRFRGDGWMGRNVVLMRLD